MVAARTSATGARAERRHGRPRRRRVRAARVLRLGHRDAEHRPARQERRALRQLPHHRAVLAHPVLPSDRPQPSFERNGARRGSRPGFPRVLRSDPASKRLPLRDPRGERVRLGRGGQVAPHTRGRDARGRAARELAGRARLPALVRVPWWRDPPVRAQPVPGQPCSSAPAAPRTGVPRHRGPGRPGDPVSRGGSVRRAGPALLPVLRHWRMPLPPPRATGMDRPLSRPVRRRLGRMARRDVRAATGVRAPPRGHGALTASALGPGLVGPRTRGSGRRRALHGVLRRVPLTRRRADRAPRGVPRGDRRAGQHDRGGRLR